MHLDRRISVGYEGKAEDKEVVLVRFCWWRVLVRQRAEAYKGGG